MPNFPPSATSSASTLPPDDGRESHQTALLVSVRDALEARVAMQCGVDWIDLKNPAAGALGAPELETLRTVGAVLHSWPRRSVALGELIDWKNYKHSLAEAVTSAGFPVAKCGLAGMASHLRLDHALQEASADLGPTVGLVPVIYGDYSKCDAPSPAAVVRAAIAIKARYLLIDTFEKRGASLLDCLDVSEVQKIVHSAAEAGIRTVLAGSIRLKHLSVLRGIGASAIGIRGAVCSGDRAGAMCDKKLSRWVEQFGSA